MNTAGKNPSFFFDHAVIIARSLSAAVTQYRRLGFTVVSGGRHEGSPTHNALITFRDGSYLELLATTDPLLPPMLRVLRRTPLWRHILSQRQPLARRFLGHFAARTGLADFALATSSLGSAIAAARARGLAIEGPYMMGRTRPDGVRLEWKLGVPLATDLPFLIEDVTPREQRVLAGAATTHALDVSGVSAIFVATREPEASVGRYQALLGRDPLPRTDPKEEVHATFNLGGVRIHLIVRYAVPHSGGPTALVLAVRGR